MVPPLEVTLTPRRVITILTPVIVLLACITVPMTVAEYRLRSWSWTLAELVRRFTLDSENSVPAWMSSLMLATAAAALSVVALLYYERADRWWRHWAGLSMLFWMLSIDEAASFHELLIAPMRALIGRGGVFYFGWVIPGVAFVAVVGLAYLKFLLHLDRATCRRFVLSAVVYVGGALGLEFLGGALFDSVGEEHIGYILVATAEEVCELVGILMFIAAIVAHIAQHVGEIRVRVNPHCPESPRIPE